MARHFVIDFGKLRYREGLRITRWAFPLWVVMRATGAIPRRGDPMRLSVPFREFEVPASEVPAPARAEIDVFVREAEASAFVEPLHQVVHQPDQVMTTTTLRH